ncbi:zonadhesin, partial [Trichonephila clavata]
MFLVLLSFLFLSVGLNSGISVPCAEVEIWAECISPCNTCEKMGHCSPPPECHKGCDCKPGYFRNETGVCVPKEKCHPVKLAKCPPNAQFSSCGSPVFPTCDNPYPIVDYDDQCLPGCFCNPGFLMSRDGTCVPEGQCLEKEVEVPYEQFLIECREDEDYYECSPSCRNTCENFNNPEIHCECGPPGCFCKEGLVLREDGMCVPPEECPEPVAPIDPCREYEDYYECSPSCKNTCENFNNPEARCECGPPGCFCKQGLVLRADGRCVQPQECPKPPAPKVTCRADEDYYECSPSCKNTCENFNNPGAKCQCGPPGCFCRRGLVLRADGRCVRPQECPKPSAPKVVCRHDEEYYECNPRCRNTCENFNNPEQKCQCGAPGCFCRQGLVLRADGRCVRPEECRKPSTPKAVCREDEDYYECNPSCRNTCENMYNQELKCECGPPGCFCREGLVLRADGRCVQPQECPKPPARRQPPPRCPKNAIYIECGSPCPPTCEDLEPEPCEEKCVQACYCKPGYVKRKDGICVKIETCLPRRRPELPPPPPKCPKNAIFIECGSPCPPTCENRYPTCEEKCTTACYCKPGYLKSKQGKCVRADQCEPPPVIERCGVDEEYYQCTPSCKNTCENFRNPTALCQCGPPGCFCKKGLVMRADGKCVRPNQCPVQCGRDEQYYTCTPSCKNTCENCTNPAARCTCGPPGCFCREGLVKRADGKCVSPNQCPKRCGVDEEYYQCTPSCKNTCKNFRNQTALCQCGPPGCFCKRGLVKRVDGKCVSPNQCPVQCGRDEQYYNCTPSCKNTCENCDNPAAICTCGLPGCFCREGLVKRADGKCVPPSQCP